MKTYKISYICELILQFRIHLRRVQHRWGFVLFLLKDHGLFTRKSEFVKSYLKPPAVVWPPLSLESRVPPVAVTGASRTPSSLQACNHAPPRAYPLTRLLLNQFRARAGLYACARPSHHSLTSQICLYEEESTTVWHDQLRVISLAWQLIYVCTSRLTNIVNWQT